MGTTPVFVDDTGRRRAVSRRVGRILLIAFTGYIGLLVVGFTRDPGLGPIHLPTFGLPSLELMAPPPRSVPSEQQAEETTSDAVVAVVTGETGEKSPQAIGRPGSPDTLTTASGGGSSSVGTVSAPVPGAGRATDPTTTSAPTTTTTRDPGSGVKSSTPTSTATSSTTTSSTTPTTNPTPTSTTGPGRGSAQGGRPDAGPDTGPTSANGPEGAGAPGQLRKTTTTTAG